jgi:hypothetical protein
MLDKKMMVPEAAAEAMRAYAEETNRLNHQRRVRSGGERAELMKVERSVKENANTPGLKALGVSASVVAGGRG